MGEIDGVEIAGQNTNMVFAKLPVTDDRHFVDQLAKRNVRALSNNGSTRLVTHLGVEEADVRSAAQAIVEVLAS
jgi:threonine aldolase